MKYLTERKNLLFFIGLSISKVNLISKNSFNFYIKVTTVI